MPPRIAILGAGIVGLATARSIIHLMPGARVTVIDKETRVGSHQSGHNSGVLHSGIYYQPGSLRAQTCREGLEAMQAYCTDHDIAWRRCGKVIVAADDSELSRLEAIAKRGIDNGVACQLIDRKRLGELEPAVSGIAALHVVDTGVVNLRNVCGSLADEIARDGDLLLGQKADRLTSHPAGVQVGMGRDDLLVDVAVNCCGLQADRMARASGSDTRVHILPFRGEYWRLHPSAARMIRSLVYPVADPDMPFLGVHFTRSIDDVVEAGPSAVPAFAREGYRRRDLVISDMIDAARRPGTWRLARRWWRAGLGELHRSVSPSAALDSMQRLLPELRREDMERAPSGVRAQCVGEDGSLIDDFLIETRDRMIHVLNAPSPAATASLAIGDSIANRVLEQLGG